MKKSFWCLWGFFVTFGILHYIYALLYFDNMQIVNIEHSFYLCLLLLSAISISNAFKGKTFLYFICFLYLSHIYLLPELEEITALESCNEGKCEQALKMGIIKIEKDVIVYIPKKER